MLRLLPHIGTDRLNCQRVQNVHKLFDQLIHAIRLLVFIEQIAIAA